MKKTGLIVSIAVSLLSAVILLGCADAAVKTAISDFKDAVNANSVSQIKSALSPESDFYITGEFQTFLDYFEGAGRPVAYSGYTINVSGENADAYASATYDSVAVGGGVWFWFRREDTFLGFLFPSYKVYRYYDYGNWSDPVWRKIQDLEAQNR